jgi:hypothetical protein
MKSIGKKISNGYVDLHSFTFSCIYILTPKVIRSSKSTGIMPLISLCPCGIRLNNVFMVGNKIFYIDFQSYLSVSIWPYKIGCDCVVLISTAFIEITQVLCPFYVLMGLRQRSI